MLTGIFDSHAHYDDRQFDEDRDRLLGDIHRGGVQYILNAGADLASSRAAIELGERHPFVYAAVGIHPHDAEHVPGDYLRQLEALAAHPKVVALGEMGLDYHYDKAWMEAQHRVFEEQLILAGELGLPVVIHDREAHGDTMAFLRKHRPNGVLHCFSGFAEMAREAVALGLYLGFTGVVTFKNARKALEAAAAVPMDRLLVETDCPYMAPEPFRGQRCDSAMLPRTIAALARVKGVTEEELTRRTCENAMRLFGIK